MFNLENIFKFKISGLEGFENELLTRAGSDRGYLTSEVIHIFILRGCLTRDTNTWAWDQLKFLAINPRKLYSIQKKGGGSEFAKI